MEQNRREFMQALGLLPFAIAATASEAAKPSAIPSATPATPEDPLAKLKAFAVPDSVEPMAVFRASRGK